MYYLIIHFGEMYYLIIHFTKSVGHLTASEAVTCSQPLRNTVNPATKNYFFAMVSTPHYQSINNVNQFDGS